MAFSHGLCFGRRQLTILTLWPLFLTSRLCLPSQRLNLAAYMPACVLLDEDQHLLLSAYGFELLSAPSEKPGRYPTHGSTIHEYQRRLPVELWQVESIAAD